MYDVISFGSATVDIIVKSDQFIQTKDILGLIPSSKNEVKQGIICSGGGATNSSVALARLGFKTACCALMGNDVLKYFIRKDLKDNGVSRNLLIHPKTESTDYSVLLVGKNGNRSVLTNRGTNCLQYKQIPWKKIQKAKWFFITSIKGNMDLLEQLIGFAVENNIGITLNPGRRELLSRQKLIPLLKYVDFLLLNKIEAETLTATKFENTNFWDKILSYGAKINAVTNGRDGAYICTTEQKIYSPIINVSPVNENGAGDSFGSAFTAAILYKKDLKTALIWGVNNSASVVSHLGPKEGLLTYKEIVSHASKTRKTKKSKN